MASREGAAEGGCGGNSAAPERSVGAKRRRSVLLKKGSREVYNYSTKIFVKLLSMPISKKIILASSSLQRQELFKKFGFEFIVQPSDFDERAVEIGDPEKLVKTLALAKAKGVAERFSGSLVVGADTVVFHNGEIFGKPQSAAHAKEMLKKLNGDTHSVITGLSLYDADTHQFVVDAVETFVSFKPISDAEIDAYVKSQEPFGKAGGYTVQGLAGLFVDRIQGDYFNVLGLPLDLLAHRLSEFGIAHNYLAR
ncbi:MAG: septum formation inhibitor Maf [Candidatus Sungbacteria bacterium]|nr:septum formation inhibitor Maf [Candidatus Sungbacteria bacterium]